MPSWTPTWPNEDAAIERRRFLAAEDEREEQEETYPEYMKRLGYSEIEVECRD